MYFGDVFLEVLVGVGVVDLVLAARRQSLGGDFYHLRPVMQCYWDNQLQKTCCVLATIYYFRC